MTYGDFKDLSRRTAPNDYNVVKHLILIKIENMIDINLELLQWFINVLTKSLLVALLKVQFCQTNIQLKNHTNQSLQTLKNENYPFLLKTIFGAMILWI